MDYLALYCKEYKRISLSNTLVLGAGYERSEYNRLSFFDPDYVGVGGDGSSVVKQVDAFNYKNSIHHPEPTADLLDRIREGRKFQKIIIDQCVQNHILENVAHPVHGKRPDGRPNGLMVSVYNEESFSVRMIARLMEPDGEILFIDPRTAVDEKILDGLKKDFKDATIKILDDEERNNMNSHVFTSGG